MKGCGRAEGKAQPSQSQVALRSPPAPPLYPPFPSSDCPPSVLQCITNSDRENGYNSSLQLPDATLNFAKKHPLMEDKALARPLLLTKGVNFTKLVVDRVSALDQRAYNMLFIGTGSHRGTLATKPIEPPAAFPKVPSGVPSPVDKGVYLLKR